jgi:hypothetical protein
MSKNSTNFFDDHKSSPDSAFVQRCCEKKPAMIALDSRRSLGTFGFVGIDESHRESFAAQSRRRRNRDVAAMITQIEEIPVQIRVQSSRLETNNRTADDRGTLAAHTQRDSVGAFF